MAFQFRFAVHAIWSPCLSRSLAGYARMRIQVLFCDYGSLLTLSRAGDLCRSASQYIEVSAFCR